MRRILNFIITGLILWIAAKFFPAHIQIANFGTLALAAILIGVIQIAIAALCYLILFFGIAVESITWIILSGIIAFCSEAIAISILSAKLEGFTVNGFWPTILLSICCSLLTISAPKEN